MLKKSQEECISWKHRFKQTHLNLKRIQLESHRYSSNLEVLQMKQQPLQEENKSLIDQNTYLEERYNKHVIESMSTIKDLQNELKMLQELKNVEVKMKNDVESKTHYKKEKEKFLAQISELSKQINNMKNDNAQMNDNLERIHHEHKIEVSNGFIVKLKNLLLMYFRLVLLLKNVRYMKIILRNWKQKCYHYTL